jgi:F0F1-type ATP synthase membrane subunit b/b'
MLDPPRDGWRGEVASMAEGFDPEKIMAEARARLSALYEKYVDDIEAEADRILRERLATLEPLRKELVESLRSIKA